MEITRGERIRKLIAAHDKANAEAMELVTAMAMEKDVSKKSVLRAQLDVKRIEKQSLAEQIAREQMNKNDSAFFEWHPHKGMNRRQARAFRRNTNKRRQNRKDWPHD